MTKELEQKLFERYNDLFAERTEPMNKTCMCWGCSCNDGWYHILDLMCKQLMEVQEKYDVKITFRQIKEKFGTLRVYYHFTPGPRWTLDEDKHSLLDGKPNVTICRAGWSNDAKTAPAYDEVDSIITEIISNAEVFSSITCEACGISGAVSREGGWIVTLCDKCEEARIEERKNFSGSVNALQTLADYMLGNIDDTDNQSREQAGDTESQSPQSDPV